MQGAGLDPGPQEPDSTCLNKDFMDCTAKYFFKNNKFKIFQLFFIEVQAGLLWN